MIISSHKYLFMVVLTIYIKCLSFNKNYEVKQAWRRKIVLRRYN